MLLAEFLKVRGQTYVWNLSSAFAKRQRTMSDLKRSKWISIFHQLPSLEYDYYFFGERSPSFCTQAMKRSTKQSHSYVIGLFIRIRRFHWLIKITGTCNPFNCRGGFSLHVSTATRNEFQILQDQRLNFNSLRVLWLYNREAGVITLCGNSLFTAKCQSRST